jgi:hypothetical protein
LEEKVELAYDGGKTNDKIIAGFKDKEISCNKMGEVSTVSEG